MTRYAELHAYSYFSFQRGASSVEDMVDRASEVGLAAVAITDRDGLYGSVRHWLHVQKRKEEGVELPQPIYGAELGLAEGGRIVALVRSREGWCNLSALITEGQRNCEKGASLLPMERLFARQEGLTVLSGGRFGPIDRALLGIDARRDVLQWRPKGPWGQPLSDAPKTALESRRRAVPGSIGASGLLAAGSLPESTVGRVRRASRIAARLRDGLGDRFFLELQDHRLPEDQWSCSVLRGLGRDLGLRCVATNHAHYARAEDRRLQDVLSCMRLHTTLEEAGTRLLPNGHFHLKSAGAMGRLFELDPGAVGLSAELAEECRFNLKHVPYQFPIYPIPEGHSPQSFLEELVFDGAKQRYGGRFHGQSHVMKQLRHELRVIRKLGLAGYFLIVWDLSQECRKRGILSQGRGSAANSCVCYCLKITAVDPIRLGLLFERFLSEERGGWPDIDIDIANSKREEVLQLVYDKYGRDHAAMVCNVITYHPRSAVRDVGKAFGLGLDQVDRMAKSLSHFAARDDLIEVFGEGGEELITDDAETLRHVLHFTEAICGFPRHIGIHSGGFVISGLPLGEACPIENATMQDRTVLQWDKDDVEHAGLVKIDLLALGMLSVIQEAARLLMERGVEFEMADLDFDDATVFDMICEADTVGLFQIESRAQMNTLPRLRPRSFYDLVIEVALIRPGPIQGQMVHPYINRRAGREEVTYAHPSLRPILERTLGVPLFQEQAMRMAITTAGMSPGEADRLRKVMGFRRGTEEMERLLDKMVKGMQAQGIDEETAIRIREQLRGFAAYGFPESHSASFAVIVYASAWLKRYESAAFTAGLLNSQPMGFYSASSIVADARRHGVVVRPLCVNSSEWRWTLEEGQTVRAGFLQIKGFLEEDAHTIVDSRRMHGGFPTLVTFCEMTRLERETLEKLAESGAFSCFGMSRREALWTVSGWRRRLPLEGRWTQGMLPGFRKLSAVEENLLDHTVTGFSPGQHPMEFLRGELKKRGVTNSQDLRDMRDGQGVYVAGLVITRQRPGTAKGTFFITTEDEVGFVNIIVQADTFMKQRHLLSKVKLLGCKGKLQVQENVVNVLGLWFENLGKQDLLGDVEDDFDDGDLPWEQLPSRDFH